MNRKNRIRNLAAAAALALAASGVPALAQVQQGNPNAANQSLSGAGQNRATQQNGIGQSNTTMMNSERAAPPPPAGGQMLGGPAPAGGAAAPGAGGR